MKREIIFGLLVVLSMLSGSLHAEKLNKQQIKGLDEQVQGIKRDVLSISTQLNLLEEKLLYPSNTYMAFFVSMDKGADFSPDSIKLTLDDKNVANYIYSYKEVQALKEGGVQRVFTTNVTTGEHNLKISVIGKESGSKVTNSGTHNLKKGVGPQFVEIHLSATGVDFRDW
ncbi:MAG TPA: hypothetical protein VKA50_00705 [Gammaproteobacteria bacterium]|nr:hypothetical protein [Gammaproteobacteria bacterium]